MTKEELKRIIAKRFPRQKTKKLTSWILSGNFDNDIEQFISEDLESELNQKQRIEVDELDSMAVEIMKKAGKSNSEKANLQIDNYTGNNEKQSRFSYFYKIAAAILLVASFTFVAYYYTKTKSTNSVVVKNITKENQRGRKSTIFLRDGSIVYLNSESKVKYPEVFSDSNRVVHIEGEAYFDVSRDESRPFIVHANNLKISVLGTSFNVNAYRENEYTKVSLNTGKVKVENQHRKNQGDTQLVELTPGKSVSYSEQQHAFTPVTAFDPNLDFSWKDGKIVFHNADMESMLNRFERWYNVDITLKNKPYFQWNYTGEFHNQTLRDVLESLSFSQSFEFSFKQDKVELIFKPN